MDTKDDFNKTIKDLSATLKLRKKISKRQLDLQRSFNLHKNFKNLTPIYDAIKYRKAKDLADVWIDKLSQKLL